MSLKNAVQRMLADPAFDPTEHLGDALVDWISSNFDVVLKTQPELSKYFMDEPSAEVYKFVALDSPDMSKLLAAIRGYEEYQQGYAVNDLLARVLAAGVTQNWEIIKGLDLSSNRLNEKSMLALFQNLSEDHALEVLETYPELEWSGKIQEALVSRIPEDEITPKKQPDLWSNSSWFVQRAIIDKISLDHKRLMKFRDDNLARTLKCWSCDKEFRSRSGHTLHWRAKAGGQCKPPVVVADEILYRQDAPHACLFSCGRHFTTLSARTLHGKTHGGA